MELGRTWLLDESVQRIGFDISGDECPDAAFALNHANDGSLVRSATPLALALAAVVRLIHFHSAIKSANRSRLFVIQHCANLFEHAPRRLVRHSRFTLNLLRGNSATRRSHQVDRIEPSRERSWRFMEDRSSGRVNMMAAMIARVRGAALHAVMLCDRFTRIAINAIWIEIIAKPLKAVTCPPKTSPVEM